jgi:hypothetical protein
MIKEGVLIKGKDLKLGMMVRNEKVERLELVKKDKK